MRPNDTGAVAASFTSLPWGDVSSASVGGTGGEQVNAIFAGLDLDTFCRLLAHTLRIVAGGSLRSARQDVEIVIIPDQHIWRL